MDKTVIEKFVSEIQNYIPSILVSVKTTSIGDSIGFRFNCVNIDNEEIIFGLRNSFNRVSFKIADIVDMTKDDDNTIQITLNNGEKFVVFLSDNYHLPKPQQEEIELDDFLSRIKQSLSTTIRFGEQKTFETRANYNNISIEDSYDDDDYDGDRYVKVTFGDEDVFTQIKLDEYETTIKLVKETDDYGVIALELPEMPHTTLMLFLSYREITMKIPLWFFNL